MPKLNRIVMIRHGETVGNSSVRYHGSSDLALSDTGRAQLRRAAQRLRTEFFDAVVASPLRRSWQGAAIVAGGAPIRLEDDFREIHFGRWEGMTAEEIRASDPALYQDWQAKAEGFEFPGGEPRGEFRARVGRGLDRLLEGGATAALLVLHKGTIRAIAEKLLGRPLDEGQPELGGLVSLSRASDGSWHEGRRSSDPVGLE
ncbi:MAG: histidine phosphatase family protein [Myxococcales bacterium]|nr:histidine phosphatase family protein [Myxococcales bacterium]